MSAHTGSRNRPLSYRLMLVLTALALAAGALVAGAGSAKATTTEQVCAELDSGKIDVENGVKSVTYTAPEGYLIDQYCVKAGSVNNENGPVYVDVVPPTKSVTITYPGGKDISHYSVSFVKASTPPPPPVCPEGQVPVDTDGDGTIEPGECGTPPTPPVPPTPPTPPVPPTPPYECPTGQFYAGDLNNNGVMDAADCQDKPKKVVVAKAKKRDKCGTVGDRFAVKRHKGIVYTANGKRVKREGVWLKTNGAKRVVIKARAANKRYKLAGPSRWVFKYSTNKCHKAPDKQAPSGMKIVA